MKVVIIRSGVIILPNKCNTLEESRVVIIYSHFFKWVSVFLLIASSQLSVAKDLVIGKDQAQLNAHDEQVLRNIASASNVELSKFRHVKRRQFILGGDGLFYSDLEKNGKIDGDDSIARTLINAKYGYITDENGKIIALKIGKSDFRKLNLVDDLGELLYFSCNTCKVSEMSLSNKSLRYLRIFDSPRIKVDPLSSLPKLTYLFLSGLVNADFSSYPELRSLKKLKVMGGHLSSFSGIDAFSNLEDFYYSEGDDVKAPMVNLSGFTKDLPLKKLVLLGVENLRDITGLEKLSSLNEFEADFYGGIDELEFKSLSKLNSLEKLTLFRPKLHSLEYLSSLVNLKEISIKHAPISDMSDIRGLTKLEDLLISNADIKNIEGLEKLENLKKLVLGRNELSSLKGLSSLRRLSYLDLAGNNIKRMDGLENNICLEEMDLSGNPVSRFEGIVDLPIFSTLHIYGTNITEFPDWEKTRRLRVIGLDREKVFEDKKLDPDYYYSYVPIKAFDIKLSRNTLVSDDERKQFNCL